ncbi:flagellar hook-associated protein 3 FlgL [Parasphingorhabdus marina DSM 22363]|uniref:Flagellin n=1 Tax=Parasphingorhabdus marina DSM 22363 TaxID=1123272 RepID=A0A1N6CW73_9SPHN|nr:flagellin [Parasphingorhabdus marina]SIN62727.1 flagellar hook-associated protein 3 FlgL [Parasphingorhabdus marina DSM 22363]
MESVNRNRAPYAIQQQLDISRIISEKQQEVSTGQKIDQPSDDPAAWLEISNIARRQADESAWQSNIGRVETRAGSAETSLRSISSGLIRMQELLIQANNDTYSQADRETIAIEMEGLLNTFRDSLAVKDSFGGDVFQNGPPLEIPINEDILVISAPSIQTVTENIPLGNGGFSDFETIITDTIAAVRSGTAQDRTDAFQPLRNVENRITDMIAQQGIVGNRLESARSYLEENAITLTERRSALEDTNLSEAISRIQSLLVNLEAAQAVYGQIEQRTLFDYLG